METKIFSSSQNYAELGKVEKEINDGKWTVTHLAVSEYLVVIVVTRPKIANG